MLSENDVTYKIGTDLTEIQSDLDKADRIIVSSSKKTAEKLQKNDNETLNQSKKNSSEKAKSAEKSDDSIEKSDDDTNKNRRKNSEETKDKIISDAKETEKKLDESGSNIAEKSGKVAKGIGIAFAAVGAAVAKIGVEAISAAGGAEMAFAQTTTLLSGSADEIDAIRKNLMNLSNETGVAFEEIAGAAYSALSAGVAQDKVVEFVEGTVGLARGGFTEIGTAIDVVTTAINAYGLEAKDAAHIQDVLITTQNLGKTTVDELAASMGKIIPTAKAFNVDLDQLGASYATVTANGIATAEATTYMNSMLNELGKSGTAASDALQEISGKTFNELISEGYNLSEIMQIMQSGADAAGKSLIDMFGSAEAAKAAQVLAGNADKFNESLIAMKNSAGITAEAAAIMEDTFENMLAKVKNQIKNAIIEFGTSLLPIATELLDLLSDNIPAISEILMSLAPVLTDMFAGFLPVAVELINAVLPTLISLFEDIFTSVTDLFSGIMPILSEFFENTSPLLIELADNILPALFAIIEALFPILETVMMLLEPILELLQNLLEPISNLITNGIAPLINVFLSLMNDILTPIMPLIGFLIDVIGVILSAAIEKVTGILQFFTTTLSNVRNILSGIIDFIAGVFTGDWERAWGGIEKIFGAVWNQIKNIAQIVVNSLIDMINAFINGVNFLLEWVGVKVEPLTHVDWTSDDAAKQVSKAIGVTKEEKTQEIMNRYGGKNTKTAHEPTETQANSFIAQAQDYSSYSAADKYGASAAAAYDASSLSAAVPETKSANPASGSKSAPAASTENTGNVISITSYIPTVWDDTEKANSKLKKGIGAALAGNSSTGKLVSGLETSGETAVLNSFSEKSSEEMSIREVVTAVKNLEKAYREIKQPLEIYVKARNGTIGRAAVDDINEITRKDGKSPLIK